MNSMPAASSVCWIARTVDGIGVARPPSKRVTVLTPTCALRARSRTPQPSAPRAILHCAAVIMRTRYVHLTLDARGRGEHIVRMRTVLVRSGPAGRGKLPTGPNPEHEVLTHVEAAARPKPGPGFLQDRRPLLREGAGARRLRHAPAHDPRPPDLHRRHRLDLVPRPRLPPLRRLGLEGGAG